MRTKKLFGVKSVKPPHAGRRRKPRKAEIVVQPIKQMKKKVVRKRKANKGGL